MQQLFSLKNKVIIVTGATGVLGESFVHAIADMDGKVVLIGRNEAVGHERAKQLQQKNKEAIFIKADVLNKDDLLHANEIILKKFNRIDGLVNAAGGVVPESVIMPDEEIFDINMDGMKRAFDLNLFGSMMPVTVFGKSLQQSGNASIVNISSMTAQTTLTRVLGYSMAKAAIDNYTRWMSVETANRYGDTMRVNAIAPGFFITHQNEKLLINKDGSYTERSENILRNTPFKRFGKPEELSGTLIWLLSDASKFVTGEVICVDGGFHINSGV
jgi:NAD(P)-dependent dehydrogenase (short-subunit alcohol dehydrogenase family)